MRCSSLQETQPIRDISEPFGEAQAAVPAAVSIHAVHVANGEIACPYVRKDSDIDEPDQDWFDHPSGELQCKACGNATQPDHERRAGR